MIDLKGLTGHAGGNAMLFEYYQSENMRIYDDTFHEVPSPEWANPTVDFGFGSTGKNLDDFDSYRESVLPGSKITDNFYDHLFAGRTPGTDFDVAYSTEGLPLSLKPRVKSGVTGKVRWDPQESKYGSVTIIDRNGWEHQYTHLNLSEIKLKQKDLVYKGDDIGIHDNTHSTRNIKDHVHLKISKDGVAYDARDLLFDPLDGAVVAIRISTHFDDAVSNRRLQGVYRL